MVRVVLFFRNQQHDKAEKEFVCQKLKLLTQTEFEEKLDKHLYQMVGTLTYNHFQLLCMLGLPHPCDLIIILCTGLPQSPWRYCRVMYETLCT